MNKQVDNYNDLLAEKKRLQELLKVQRALIKQDVEELKEQVQPVANTVSFVSKIFSRDSQQTLLGVGLGMSVEVLLKKLLKTNWIARLIVPGLARNISSHFTSANAENNWTGIISKLFKKKGKEAKGQAGTEAVLSQ
ncbi:MAG: hypothetical protein QM731_15985 [Chitinophagaceae bacterium]